MLIFLLLLLYLVLGACACLLLCVDPNGKGCLSAISRLVLHRIPQALSSLGKKILGERLIKMFEKVRHYFVETNHPIVQIFYLIISPGGYFLYEYTGFNDMDLRKFVNQYQVWCSRVLASICFYLYYKACTVSPGIASQTSHSQKAFSQYYDGLVYRQNNMCKTCKVVKPARSSHCSVCGFCVLKYDHHCIWVRQCVGLCNYKWFVSFLISHSIWCSFLSYIGYRMISNLIQGNNLLNVVWQIGNQQVQSNWVIVIQYILFKYPYILFLTIMCLIMGVSLTLFWSYHIRLIVSGQTTKERLKRSDICEDLNDKKRMLQSQSKDKQSDKKNKGILQNISRDLELVKFKRKRSILDEFKQILNA